MAAPISSVATTLEGQLFEMANAVQARELSMPEADRPNNVTVALDTEGGLVTIAATVPVTYSADATGQMVVAVKPYLNDTIAA